MDNIIDDEYKIYSDNSMFLQPEQELESYFEEAISVGYYDSSSPDGTHESSPPASKNIVSERNRRQKLNQRLYALRSVVPNITKMDKASTIKDAIEYIQSLHDEERRIQAEISELESSGGIRPSNSEIFCLDQDHDQATTTFSSNPKRTRIFDHYYDSSSAPSSTILMPSPPVELLELRVSSIAEIRTIVVSLTCSKRTDTMVKLCEIFESLKLKIITANITAFSGRLLKTVFLEADEEEKEVLSLRIKAAIAALNDPNSPMSI